MVSTRDFDSRSVGSNPAPPTMAYKPLLVSETIYLTNVNAYAYVSGSAPQRAVIIENLICVISVKHE